MNQCSTTPNAVSVAKRANPAAWNGVVAASAAWHNSTVSAVAAVTDTGKSAFIRRRRKKLIK